MKRILLLCRRDERTDYDTSQTMKAGMKGFETSDVTYVACDYEDLVISYDTKLSITTSDNIDLNSFDAIFQFGWFKTKLLEDTALSVARYAEHFDIPHANQEALYTRSRTKISQYVIAGLAGIQTIPFIVAGNSEAITSWARNHEFPLIVKAVAASRGNHNYLAKSNEEIEQIVRDNPEQQFVVQTFIENDGDYRLIILDGAVKLAIHRKGEEGSHLNNTSKGGSGIVVPVEELSQAMLDEAITISRELRREIGGVDMVVDKRDGKHYFLEANNMPQLSTGSNVSAKLSVLNEYLVSKSKR
jgi:glutathione synthase/RimK-type ligase-like ATP-grasp enzyme